MNRRDVVLAALAAGAGSSYSPVQLQKAVFLISENVAEIKAGAGFDFVPYDYGPFDRGVYVAAQELEADGLVAINPSRRGRWKEYSATASGMVSGSRLLDGMTASIRQYVVDVSTWVRSQDFATLVKSIYQAYPNMKENSIFKF